MYAGIIGIVAIFLEGEGRWRGYFLNFYCVLSVFRIEWASVIYGSLGDACWNSWSIDF